MERTKGQVVSQEANFEDISKRLAPHIVELARFFWGAENKKLSSSRQLRWGANGKLAVATVGPLAGRWIDYSDDARSHDALDLICKEMSCSVVHAARWATSWLGAELSLSETSSSAVRGLERPLRKGASQSSDADLIPRRTLAVDIWNDAVDITSTIGAAYLENRRIPLDLISEVSGHALRFHPACPRVVRWGENKPVIVDRAPSMIAAVSNVRTCAIQGIHRTFLAHGTGAKINDGGPVRLALGILREGAVMLSPSEEVTLGLHIGEGIETVLSVMALGIRPAWACLSAGNVAAFPVLSGIEALTIFADHDEAKGPQLRRAGEQAALAVIERWKAAGKEVAAIQPPQEGTDWNDVIREVGYAQS
jgi:hypothetical protein